MVNREFIINSRKYRVSIAEDLPLLWLLRDHLGLMGTKFGCGQGICGACNVLVDGLAVRSCMVAAVAVADSDIVTIEGLSDNLSKTVMNAWLAEQVTQCGYCQPGQIIAAVSLLRSNSDPSDIEIVEAMDSVLCRCGTYTRILKAIKKSIKKING